MSMSGTWVLSGKSAPTFSPIYNMGASSRSPSPMTMDPRIGTVSIVWRMVSVAIRSDRTASPNPIVLAEAIAAFSTTRSNSRARSLSMFLPKLFAFMVGFPREK